MTPEEIAEMRAWANSSAVQSMPSGRRIRRLCDALEAAHQPVPTSYACQRCGRRDGLDAVAPNEVWAKLTEGTLHPSGEVTDGRWSILCLWCMDELAEQHGIKVSLSLHFAGRALFGTSNSDADRDWITQLFAEKQGAEKFLEEKKRVLCVLLDSLRSADVQAASEAIDLWCDPPQGDEVYGISDGTQEVIDALMAAEQAVKE